MTDGGPRLPLTSVVTSTAGFRDSKTAGFGGGGGGCRNSVCDIVSFGLVPDDTFVNVEDDLVTRNQPSMMTIVARATHA